MHTALRATSQTIREFLQHELEVSHDLGPFFDSGAGGTMRVTTMTPQQMADANLTGLSVWLYRVCRDEQVLNSPPERVSPTQLRRPALPMRLHYLITPLAPTSGAIEPETSQVILGKVLQLAHDKPLLRGTDLRGDLAGTERELSLRLENLTLDEITRVWDALDSSYQLSVSYEVSVVPIDSAIAPARVSPVMTAQPEHLVRSS